VRRVGGVRLHHHGSADSWKNSSALLRCSPPTSRSLTSFGSPCSCRRMHCLPPVHRMCGSRLRVQAKGHVSAAQVPTGAAILPAEIYRALRSWAAASFNIQQWTLFQRGGHFAALEMPAELTADMRTFFAQHH